VRTKAEPEEAGEGAGDGDLLGGIEHAEKAKGR
jgi:hypothetical protein